MYKLVIKRANNTVYWTELFKDEVSGQAWLKEEKTRSYWLPEFTTQLTQVQPEVPVLTPQEQAAQLLDQAIDFGNKLIRDITIENMALGITQDGMTGTVRKALAETLSALMTGSLYDAIDELRAIPEDKKDNKYISNARLLVAINKLETYLGKPLSSSL